MNKITIVRLHTTKRKRRALLIKADQQRTLLKRARLGLRIVVVDDGNSDETAAIVERRAEDDRELS